MKLLEVEEGAILERRSVTLSKPIKTVGTVEIHLRLKEDVPTSFFLKVVGERQIEEVKTHVKVKEEGAEAEEKKPAADQGEPLLAAKEQKAEMRDELEERTKE